MGGHSHKPGALKQSNKKHKTSSASKRSVKRSFGNGRVDSQSLGEGKLGKKERKSQLFPIFLLVWSRDGTCMPEHQL